MDIHYNAFISYRHHPRDIKVAETIHRSLERFKVPKALRQQGKKIERLFRDKEELPITSSLTDTITMALRNSDYQIVICSTHTKESYWVQREIETFLQTHTKDKVLTVLVDGDNPYDVIPEILTYNEVIDPVTGEVTREPIEPLSCDWRLPKRKAMRTELPRLAAVLLGCTYDDLIQRQKQYRQRRLVAGISTGMAASLALAGYFLYTSIQIRENLEQALRNQSQYLASASQERFGEGDRLTAIALALEALPLEDSDRPYVAAAEQSLTNAMMLYEAEGQLISVAAYNTENTIRDFVVSDDGKTLYIMDSQYTVTAWDTDVHKKLSTFNVTKTQNLSPTMYTDNQSNLLTLGGPEGNSLLCYTRDGQLLWQTEHIEDFAYFDGKETLLAIRRVDSDDWRIATTFELLQIDPKNGSLTAEPYVMCDRDAMSTPYFTTECYCEGQPISIYGYISGGGYRVVTSDPDTQTTQTVLEFNAFFFGSAVTEDGLLYVLVTENEDVTNGRLTNYYFYTQNGAFLYCIDMNSGRHLWRTDITAYNYSDANTVIPISGSDRLFCQYGSAFLQLDAKTGKILAECHSTAIPLSLQMRENNVWVLFANGCAGTYSFDNNQLGYIQYMDNGLLMGHNNNGIYVVPQLTTNLLLYRTTSDDSYEVFRGIPDDYIHSMCTNGSYIVYYGTNQVSLLHLADRQSVWSAETKYSCSMLGFSSDGTTIYGRSSSTVYRIDAATGEVTEWALPLTTDTHSYSMYYNAINYANDTICCMIHSYLDDLPRLMFANPSTGESEIVPLVVEEDSSTWNSYGSYPTIVHVTEAEALFRTASDTLYRFDRSTQEVTAVTTGYTANSIFLDDSTNGRYVFSTAEGILITDTAYTPTLTIPLEDTFAVSFFVYEDLLLCLTADGVVLRFDSEGNNPGATALSLYSSFFYESSNIHSQKIPVTWTILPDGQILVNAFRMGNVINPESWGITCDIEHLVLYDAASDSFICQANEMIYAYRRRSLEDIMIRAKEELNGFALSDEQRDYYGLANSQ